MGASRTLLRKLDLDLIARMEASGRIEKKKRPPLKRKPRSAESYRGARRNATRETKAVMLRLGEEVQELIAPAASLNRSDRWVRATSYAYAREISPSAEPVR